MIQYSRLPAIVTLLAVLTPGTVFLCVRHSDATTGGGASKLIELKAAIARPDVSPKDWMDYGQALQEAKKYGQAAFAYESLLKVEPMNRQARLQGASCLALSDSTDDYFEFVRDTIKCDPKLAVEVLRRPEAQPYLSAPRFQTLQREAIAQSMD